MWYSSQKVFKVKKLKDSMRIRLEIGKQKELINKLKEKFSWKELSKITELSSNYLRIDVQKEKVLLSEENYRKLCKLMDINFDNYIIEKLSDNWGKSLGGKNSRGSTIKLKILNNKIALAELVGIILGDGNINYYKKGKNIGVYQIKIAGDYMKDREYHLNYVKPLFESVFNLNATEITNEKYNGRFICLSSKELVEFFAELGLPPGNKIKNQVKIPKWVFDNNKLLKCCIRGLIDTDGSIFKMSKRDSGLLRISFTNHNIQLLNDVKIGLKNLGFSVSKIINNKSIFISRKEDIERYLKEIGFSNQKHIDRLQKFRNSLVV